jgi:hypothetical protein
LALMNESVCLRARTMHTIERCCKQRLEHLGTDPMLSDFAWTTDRLGYFSVPSAARAFATTLGGALTVALTSWVTRSADSGFMSSRTR